MDLAPSKIHKQLEIILLIIVNDQQQTVCQLLDVLNIFTARHVDESHWLH